MATPDEIIDKLAQLTIQAHNISAETLVRSLDDQMRQFWNLETTGIKIMQDKKMTIRNSEVLSDFHNSFCRVDDRRVVKLPWIPELILSFNNYKIALERFQILRNKFFIHPDLKDIYTEQMQNYIDNQFVELAHNSHCNESKLFYLHHYIVKKRKDNKNKWRILSDASSHTPGHPSLNDALEQGPNLLPDIFTTLLRFRLHKFAVTSN
ncbi:uncharacterized protein LOC129966283 [Argiope bruennichi]|uniref:uncharacterized protein LOC129966283 n=1 Tax=Argiope bruennichi TaxID=94029 RepID=UPI002494AA3E|nr:uncharacterized protein LOC129966283 [Argiope bruennichi]